MFFWIATGIFIVSFGLIISEKIDKTKVALVGAGLMMALNIVTQNEAFYDRKYAIDYNVIFLLFGMMVIVNILSKTGVFQFLAIKSAKLVRGKPVWILILFTSITAVFSSFLNNVTTVLILVPVSLFIADELGLDPFPFLLSEIMASSLGGTATLIGGPPNILIASKVQLTFMDFIYHLTPGVLFVFSFFLLTIKLLFGKKLQVKEEVRQKILAINEYEMIKSYSLLIKSLSVLGLVIPGFIFSNRIHLEPATIAILGAAILLIISKENLQNVLRELEWPTLFYFIGLFIVVAGVVKVGLISTLSDYMVSFTKPDAENMFATSIVILWFSAIASTVMENTILIASIIPLVTDMAQTILPSRLDLKSIIQHPTLMPVWWSLALGTCLGGNATPIGASANIVTLGLAERAGYPIPFKKYLIYGIPLTIEMIILSTVYIWLRYYVLKFYL
ncbi:MAG: ArsB/NhaD family transporter [Candidatus Brocadiaceae bacterium]|uniref:SLC13 family permease n=1 Tax=Candidatus Wunengus sp. YC61 TaxID=3367698 RepID=UPI00271C9E94|nr:ArsB/NhaD family transporter [Candidatus Brocadiaceae bacterium]